MTSVGDISQWTESFCSAVRSLLYQGYYCEQLFSQSVHRDTKGGKEWKREKRSTWVENISRSTSFFSHCWSFCSMSVKMWMCSVSPCMSSHLVFLDCRQISFCVWPYITELDFHALRILCFGTCNTGNSQLLGKIKSPCRNLLFVSKCKRGGIVRLFIAQAAWRACCRSWEQLEMLRCSTSACDF